MVFVRVQGCNLIPAPCQWCDTKYAQDSENGKEMSIKEIVEEVIRLSPYYKSWVCITGGEPLWYNEALKELVQELKKGGYRIEIETNGSFRVPGWYTLVDSWVADMKCPSSGVCGVSKEEWFKTRLTDCVKFVVGTKEDLAFTKEILSRHKSDNPTVLVSPMTNPLLGVDIGEDDTVGWDRRWLQEVVEFCKENRVGFSLQIQKIIWGNKKGV